MFKDLFSKFDYSRFKNFILNNLSNVIWLLGICWIILFFNKFYYKKNNFFCLQKNIFKFHYLKKKSEGFFFIKGFFRIFFSVFFVILGTKFWGLIPYIYSNTSQILFVQSLAVRIWFSIIISRLFKNSLGFFYLFFPRRPGFILPFLNLIELVRFFIRSLTLTLRLSINITTGHIFVSLLRRIILFLLKNKILFFLIGMVIVLIRCGIFIFESCIRIIQALVFSLLLTRYFREHTFLVKLKFVYMVSYVWFKKHKE